MKIEQEQQKRILISPLNWGLGHASRLIPVIRELDIRGFKIMIAADGKALKLLQNEFPAYCFFNLKEYNVRYSRYIPLSLKMFFLAPIILFGIRKEHFQLKQLINEFNIDYVISDNRFGLYSKKTHCIFITHQINIHVPAGLFFLKPFITFLNHYYIRKFNDCWIPDYCDLPSLAGNLSHNINRLKNLKYIGLLSRFTIPEIKTIDFPVYDILIILSGPEPQRSIFEKILCRQLKNKNHKVLMIRGIPEDRSVTLPENVEARDHLEAHEMKAAILSSKYIISRAGYSTIMDLIALKKSAILVPTPGQTEQKYLAEYYHEKGIFYSTSQKKFDLDKALKISTGFINKIELPEINYNYFKFNDSYHDN